jgi:hypothetical protein
MIYYFYSRKKGYPCNIEIRTFTSSQIYDPFNHTYLFIGLTGKEILNKLDNLNNLNYKINSLVKKKLIKACNINLDWYYYPKDTIITTYSSDW